MNKDSSSNQNES